MGGLGSIIGDLARTAVRKFAPAAEESVDRAEYEANDLIGAKDAYLRIGGEAGAKVKERFSAFQVAKPKYLTQLDAPVNEAQKAILDHPILRNKAGLNAPLKDVYKEAAQLGHPLGQSGSVLDQLMTLDKDNADKSLMQIKNLNPQKARLLAAQENFGSHMEHIIPYVLPALESKDPSQEAWAKGVMNLISNETKDTTTRIRNGSEQLVSSSKQSIADEIGRRNKALRLRAVAAGTLKRDPLTKKYDYSDLKQIETKAFNVSPTYLPPKGIKGEFERRMQNVFRVVQLPMVALKHISTIGNLSSIHAPELIRGMLRMSDPEFKSFMDATYIHAYTDHDFMDRAMRGGSGLVAKWSGNPTAGQIFFGSYHMPLFDRVRSTQLSYAASVGWGAVQNWAKQATEGSKIAIANLKEIGIDVDKVIQNKGILDESDLKKGVFHFVNNRFFLDKTVEQALYSNKNMLMRSATMYHTFVNAQARFLRRELTKMVKARDYVGIAQFAGTIGVLWPAIAPAVKGLEIYARTLSLKQAQASATQDYSNLNPLTASQHFTKFRDTYIDMLAYYAAFGVYTNYIAAAHGDRLMYAIAGPSVGVPLRAGQDALNFITHTNTMGKHNAAPLVRDALEDTLPIVGNITAHQLVPTPSELRTRSGRISRLRRPRRESAEEQRWEF